MSENSSISESKDNMVKIFHMHYVLANFNIENKATNPSQLLRIAFPFVDLCCLFRFYTVLEILLVEDGQNTLRPFWFSYLVISANLLGKNILRLSLE